MQEKRNLLVETKEFMPEYGSDGAAGFDIKAYLPQDQTIRIGSGESVIIPTGMRWDIPEGYEVQLRSRSGLTAKNGIVIAQGTATIDEDYTGEVGIILYNQGKDSFYVTHGMRICQGLLKPVTRAIFKKVSSINKKTSRGTGAYGSTGV